jgi:hypothetical protein
MSMELVSLPDERVNCNRGSAGRRRGHHWRLSLAVQSYLGLLIGVFCSAHPLFPQGSAPTEYQVKAAFLLNFARFIEWPPDAFQNEKTPITLCVFRYDPFGSALDEVIRGKAINNRDLLARRVNALQDVKACQLVFVSDREDAHLSEIANRVRGTSALVVGEAEGFAERGGAVQFFLENNKLRFAVNVDAVARARLQVSSRLLGLARIVHDAGHPKGS